MGVATFLSFLLKFPFLSLALLLETSGLVNHQHLMIFLDFYLRLFQHREELWNRFCYPLHIIVHHEGLSNLVIVTRELYQSLSYLED